MNKQQIINKIIALEGSYVNDPSDSGGETKFGITQDTASSIGYIGKMRDLSKDQAYNIYDSAFWSANRCDEILILSENIALEIFEMSIHLRFGEAAKILQRTINTFNNCRQLYEDVDVDCIIGSKTLASLKKSIYARGDEIIVRTMNALQCEYYVRLCERRNKDEKFVYGWIKNRVKL